MFWFLESKVAVNQNGVWQVLDSVLGPLTLVTKTLNIIMQIITILTYNIRLAKEPRLNLYRVFGFWN